MFFVHRVNINQQGTQANSIQRYDDEVQARKRYYNILAADIDNDNFIYEMVLIVREDGIVMESQVFDNRPVPDPEPEPEE